MENIIIAQFAILAAGVIFAWTNFTIELIDWYGKKECTTGCATGKNPFLTPCFYGAIFFTIAFVLSILILKGQS